MGAVTADSSCILLELRIPRMSHHVPDSSECHGPRATASSTRHLCPIFLRTDPKLCRACDATALQERRQEGREAVASVRLQRVPILTALLERSFTLHHHHRRVFPIFVIVPPAGLASSSFPLPWEAHSHSDLSASSRTCLAVRAHRRTAPRKETEEDTFTASWTFNSCLSSS